MDWYFMCKNQGESVAQFFLHCVVARGLWSLVFVSLVFHVVFYLCFVMWIMPSFIFFDK